MFKSIYDFDWIFQPKNEENKINWLDINDWADNLFPSNEVNDSKVNNPYPITFQESGNVEMDRIVDFHNDLMFYLIIVVVIVFWMISASIILFNKNSRKQRSEFTHNKAIEQIWTLTPGVFLGSVSAPSFTLLYTTDDVYTPTVTLKVLGNQWYWSYEYTDFLKTLEGTTISFDSYMLHEDDLSDGWHRLLEVDNKVFLPINHTIRILVTSRDVIHSWAIPSLGVKIDACPGRLNQIGMQIKRIGTFYGQCSELCGINHAFMPVAIETLTEKNYITWLTTKSTNN